MLVSPPTRWPPSLVPQRDAARGSCLVVLADIRTALGDETLLDSVERHRRDAYRREEDRVRFVLGASLVRMLAGEVSGTDPRDVTVARDCPRCGAPHGRPRLPGIDLHVSVSHSADLVGVAATVAAPVGLDIEAVGAAPEDGVRELTCTAAEPISTDRDFYTYWCRKESVVKATGDGLEVPLTEVAVSPATQPARLVSYQGRGLAATMHDLDVGAGYAAALTVLADAPVDVARHWWAEPADERR